MAIVNNADGFTDYNSTGTVYYVSSSGSNSNAGTSEAAPFATIAHAYAQVTGGTGAKILLRRGEQFSLARLAWTKSGASSTDFLVLGAYGPLTDAQPLVNCTGAQGIEVQNTTVKYVAFQSIHFAAAGTGAQVGLSFLFQGQGTSKELDYIDVEDCFFSNFYRGHRWQTGDPVNLIPQSPTPATNIRIVRCQFNFCAIGIYSSMIHTGEIRDNIYGACGTNLLEHGCYFDDARYFVTKPAIQYRGNIAMGDDLGGGEGHKVRCVSELGEMKGNFSARYGIGLTAGSGGDANGGGTDMDPGYALRANVLSNVVTEGRNMKDGNGVLLPRGQGIWLIWLSGAGSTVRYNCITDMQGGYRAGIVFSNGPSNAVTIDQNTCYNAGSSGGSALYSLQAGSTLTGIIVTTNRFRDTTNTPLIISESGTFNPVTRSGNTLYNSTGSNLVVGAGTATSYGTVVANADVGLVGAKPTITTFLASIGILGDYNTLRLLLLDQRRGRWDTRLEGYRICDHWMAWAGYPPLSAGASNVPPTANAGPDASVTDTDRNALVTATLNLTGSTDGDGTIATYVVKQSTTTLYSGSDSTPDVVVGLGLNTLSVTCVDDDGATSNADTVVITGKPGVPTTLGNSTSVAAVTLTCAAYAGVNYEWQYGISTGVYTATVQTSVPQLAVTGLGASTGVFWRVRAIVPGVNGDYTAEQTATTGAANNNAPVANHTPGLALNDEDSDGYATVSFDGSASTDSDGTVVGWTWKEGSTTIATGSTATASLSIGVHQIDLIVLDNGGTSSAPKRGQYSARPTNPNGVGSVQQDGLATLFCASYPNASGYLFRYGSTTSLGTTVRSPVPSITVAGSGKIYWDVAVEAGSIQGESTSTQETNPIVVELHPPVANAGSDITDTDTDNTGFESVTLDGSGSTDNGNDIVGWYWVHEGDVLSTATETYALSAPVGVTSYFLTVIDEQGSISSESDEVVVSVTPAQVGTVAVVPGDGKLVIAWPVVEGGVSYTAQASTTSNFAAVVSTASSDTNSTTLLGLTNSTLYYVRVRATKDALNGAWSANASGTPIPREEPDVPVNKAYKRVERFLRLVRFGRS